MDEMTLRELMAAGEEAGGLCGALHCTLVCQLFAHPLQPVCLSNSSAFVLIDVIIESYVAEAIKSAHESFYLRIKTRPHVWI
jgi:hypothetical protein